MRHNAKRTISRLCLASALAMGAATASAQKAGDIITGTVEDEFGPLAGVNIVEVNADNRVIAGTVTDVNGNFSMKVTDPVKNRLKFSFIGMKDHVTPINKMSYSITLEDNSKTLDEVVVKSTRVTNGSGLSIPETEISTASQRISATEFEGMPVTSVDEALQGRISGLDIVAASGNLGAGTSMRLRGVSSINGNTEPLIVVDGNVWESDYNKDFDFANATEDKFAELLSVNPEDIESISVLKDAAATAIWGSQGANGVIEIKTKRGARGQTRVNYSYRANMTWQPKGMKLMNGGEYTMYLKEAYFNPRLSDDAANIPEINYLHSDAEFSEWRMYDNSTDWIDAVTQLGLEQKHYLSLTGGGEKANFRVSAGYDHQTGSVIEQVLDRFTTRTALDYFLSDRIKITANYNLTYTNNQKNLEPTITTNGAPTRYGLLALANVKMPNLAIYEEDEHGSTGEFYHMRSDASSVFNNDQKLYVNPVALGKEAVNDEKTFNIQPEFILKYDLLGLDSEASRLTYDGKINFSIFNKYNDTFYPSSLVQGTWSSQSRNAASSNSYKSFAVTTTHSLTWQPHFTNPDHSFLAMVRGQLTNGTSKTQASSVYGLPFGSIQSPSADGVIGGEFKTGSSHWRSIYMTATAHYAYKGRYIADLTFRRDGSTKFGKDQRWGNFPGVSFRWNLSDEAWMQGLTWLSMLSLRPGWGIVGNQPMAENLYFAKYGSTDGYMGNTSLYPSNIALNSLKWEEKESYNLGVDFGFLDGKISGDVNVYTQKTTDLLMYNYAIPSSSGFPTLSTKNAGDMVNNGWEVNLNVDRLIKLGRVGLDLNLTFANNKNEITKMDETILKAMNADFNYQNGSYLTRVQLNNPFGAIFGFRSLGVYQYSEYSETEVEGVSGPNAPVVRNAEGKVVLDEHGFTKPMYFAYGTSSEYQFTGGDAIYEDVNHDGNINELDIVYLGSSLPKFTGGFGFKLTWKRLSWNNQFNFRYGNKIVNAARMRAESMYNNNNMSKAVNWRWRVEGDITDIPRAAYQYGYNWLGSDRFVEDGSFLRLNYSVINYSFDPKVLKKYGLNQLSLFVSGSNIFCLTKYSGADPEVNYGGYGVVMDNAQTPRAKLYSVGINIGF